MEEANGVHVPNKAPEVITSHSTELESADEAPQISSDVVGQKGQLAHGRASTIKRTKRRTLKRRSQRENKTTVSDGEPQQQAGSPPPTTVQEVMSMMERGRSNLETQLSCLTSLEKMVELDASHRSAAAMLGVVDPVMNALQEHHSNSNLAATGCWVMSNLATMVAMCDSIMRANGALLILKVMDTHNASADVLHAGCAALCNLAIQEEWRKQLYEAGIVEGIMRAMVACPDSEWVQYTAIQTLQNLCNTGSLCYGIVDKGAIQPIFVAMETMEDHDDLQQSACWMLSSIAFSTDDDYRSKVSGEGVVPRIVKALESAPQHKGVQFTGCSALSNFARTEQLIPGITECKAIPALTHAISAFPTHQGILAVAFRTLVLLSREEHAKHQMYALDLPSLCDQRLNGLTEGPAVIEARQLRLLLGSNDGRRCCLLA